MKYLILKSHKDYLNFYKLENFRMCLRFVSYNCKLPSFIRQHAVLRLFKEKSRVKFRCYLTGNSRSVFSHFKISRIKLRTLASNGLINGLKKTNN